MFSLKNTQNKTKKKSFDLFNPIANGGFKGNVKAWEWVNLPTLAKILTTEDFHMKFGTLVK